MTDIKFEFKASDKATKNVIMKVTGEDTIEVTYPRGVSEETVMNILVGKRGVLENRLAQYRKLSSRMVKPLTYGSVSTLAGGEYPVIGDTGARSNVGEKPDPEFFLKNGSVAPFFCGGGFFERGFHILPELEGEKLERALECFYKEAGRRYLPGRTAEIAGKLGTICPPVGITSAKTLWGSCTHDRKHGEIRINYSWRLMLATVRCIDSVIVHELCHIADSNHGDRFWRHVKNFMPDYPEASEELKKLAGVINARWHI